MPVEVKAYRCKWCDFASDPNSIAAHEPKCLASPILKRCVSCSKRAIMGICKHWVDLESQGPCDHWDPKPNVS